MVPWAKAYCMGNGVWPCETTVWYMAYAEHFPSSTAVLLEKKAHVTFDLFTYCCVLLMEVRSGCKSRERTPSDTQSGCKMSMSSAIFLHRNSPYSCFVYPSFPHISVSFCQFVFARVLYLYDIVIHMNLAFGSSLFTCWPSTDQGKTQALCSAGVIWFFFPALHICVFILVACVIHPLYCLPAVVQRIQVCLNLYAHAWKQYIPETINICFSLIAAQN